MPYKHFSFFADSATSDWDILRDFGVEALFQFDERKGLCDGKQANKLERE